MFDMQQSLSLKSMARLRSSQEKGYLEAVLNLNAPMTELLVILLGEHYVKIIHTHVILSRTEPTAA